jgi:hypothetical protein
MSSEPFLFLMPGTSNTSGELHYFENTDLFPNGIKRCFWVSGVQEGEKRGNHAHKKEAQVVVAISGFIEVKVEDAQGKNWIFSLSGAGNGLFIPPLHWVEVSFSLNSVLLGLSNLEFSEEDFIRNYDDFRKLGKELS